MKKLGLGLLSAAYLLSAGTALATNGNQLSALGTYGAGMGGAVTAAPFDSTTAVTNPAGLTKVGTRADFDFEMLMPVRSVDFSATGGAKSEGGSASYLIPAVGWNAPVNEDNTLFFGGGMFIISGMGVDYDVVNVMPFFPAPNNTVMFDGRVFSQYQLWKMAPSLAKKFSDSFSVGVALNVDYQQMAIKQMFTNTSALTMPGPTTVPAGGYRMGVDLSTPESAMGLGFTVGALYDVNEMFSIGVNYSSKQTFGKMQWRLMKGDINYSPDGGTTMYTNRNGTYSIGMDAPQQYAIGLAIRPTSDLLVSLDYKMINFADTNKTLSIEGTYDTVNMGTGTPGTASSLVLNTGWKDVTVLAIGVQYKLGDKGFIRAGYNAGGSPIDSGNASQNWALPAIAKTHYMFGGTWNASKNWQLNLAYENMATETLTGAYGDKISLGGASYSLGLSYLFL